MKDGLSCAQIAEQMDCSKTLVITTLKRLGVLQAKKGSRTKPENYRSRVAPYGFRVVDGKLVSSRSEMKICRLVVELVERRGLNLRQAAKVLEAKGLKGMSGLRSWHKETIGRIYARWKGKL
jgi:transposase